MARVHRVRPAWPLLAVVVALLLRVAPLAAQSDDESAPAEASDELSGEGELGKESEADSSGLLGDEQAIQEERAPREEFRETTDPYEEPGKRYFFLGAGWRMFQMPSWLLGLGLKAAPSVGTQSAGAVEFAYRKSGFQVTASGGFYNWNFAGPFQKKNDIIDDTEWLSGKLNIFTLSSAITWSTSFTDWFAIEYGLEAGLGFLFGDITRSEAVKRGNKWGACPTWASQTTNRNDRTRYNPDFSNPTRAEQRYCEAPLANSGQVPPATNSADEEGAHYNVKAKHGLFNGGIPRVVPILGPRASLRFKPIHQLVVRVDIPLPALPFGFMGGVTAQYGF